MINPKGKYLFLLYASYIHYKGREYGDLAANISPTNENPFTNVPLKIYLVFSSVQFSLSVVSDSLWPYES